eukprot:GHUV01034919.1.p2 GENE.GHUV01034919.1~~GHUV01034919.1.p2  ORF type:complete len:220 (+),score=69.18 GHUV01034919.1:110-769(+)
MTWSEEHHLHSLLALALKQWSRCSHCCRRMDWILQKDAEKKEARKHKKAAAGKPPASAVPSQPGQNLGSSAPGSSSSSSDPATAAAALQAFGAVVNLCTQPGCRRARLLKHFGEYLANSTPLNQQHKVSDSKQAGKSSTRCCDHCDSPGLMSAHAQQLKEMEVELLQRRTQRRGCRSNKRQRGGGLFKNGWGAGDSDDGEASRSGEGFMGQDMFMGMSP